MMLKDTYYPVVVRINEDVAEMSMLSLHGENNEKSEKQDIVTNIEFEAIFSSIKRYFFHQIMIDFFKSNIV